MTSTQTNGRPRRVIRQTPSQQIPTEESALLKADREANYQKARAIFERVRPQLINDHYNWYITIEPDSEEYFLSKSDFEIFQKLQQSHQHMIGKVTTFRLNETGLCGSIL